MGNTYFKSGSWNVICDSCGRKFKSTEVRKRWDGLIVCKEDFEMRHPMDFLRIPEERLDVPFTRPESTDVFVPGDSCTVQGRSSIPGYAVAGCSIPSLTPTI